MSEELSEVPIQGARWESTDAFIATCKAMTALTEALRELKEKEVWFSINEINTFQDLLREQGYSIQKIK